MNKIKNYTSLLIICILLLLNATETLCQNIHFMDTDYKLLYSAPIGNMHGYFNKYFEEGRPIGPTSKQIVITNNKAINSVNDYFVQYYNGLIGDDWHIVYSVYNNDFAFITYAKSYKIKKNIYTDYNNVLIQKHDNGIVSLIYAQRFISDRKDDTALNKITDEINNSYGDIYKNILKFNIPKVVENKIDLLP